MQVVPAVYSSLSMLQPQTLLLSKGQLMAAQNISLHSTDVTDLL